MKKSKAWKKRDRVTKKIDNMKIWHGLKEHKKTKAYQKMNLEFMKELIKS